MRSQSVARSFLYVATQLPTAWGTRPYEEAAEEMRRSFSITSRTTCSLNSSEYLAAEMGTILSTQGKKTPQSEKHWPGRTSYPSRASTPLTAGGRSAPSRRLSPPGGWTFFPAAAQVVQVRYIRTTKNRRARSKSVELVYLICSLPMAEAQPGVVAAWIHGHWKVENRLHWVRDVVFDEDHHQLRTGNGPEIMATLRNLAIHLFHTTRSLSGRPTRAIRLLTQPIP